MNRIEKVRELVDEIIMKIPDNEEKRCAYLHLYGVSQAWIRQTMHIRVQSYQRSYWKN